MRPGYWQTRSRKKGADAETRTQRQSKEIEMSLPKNGGPSGSFRNTSTYKRNNDGYCVYHIK